MPRQGGTPNRVGKTVDSQEMGARPKYRQKYVGRSKNHSGGDPEGNHGDECAAAPRQGRALKKSQADTNNAEGKKNHNLLPQGGASYLSAVEKLSQRMGVGEDPWGGGWRRTGN